ncbi:MAG: hypothetical protein ABIQ43_09540 [Sphingomonas sp.]
MVADVLTFIWETIADIVGTKFGWKVGLAVLLAPFVLLALIIWLVVVLANS